MESFLGLALFLNNNNSINTSTDHSMDSLVVEYGDLVIHEVEETGVELGRGSYGVVSEVRWRGKVRAAKKLHDFFFEPELRDLPGAKKEVWNFKREFQSWIKLDHPNMVRLLGLYYSPRCVGVPIIVMEKMDTSLGDYLERHTRDTFPLDKKVCVLLQVAQGLNYLHGQTPPLVHHDLKPDNVLLNTNTFTAKLSDFGMIRAITPGNLARASSVKGTPVFMPPEAMTIPLRYDVQLDVFSFGVVIISTLVNNKAPVPSPAIINQGGRQVAVTEFDRRKRFTDQFTTQERHLFMPMVAECLEFSPEKRPRSSQLVDQMNTILASLQRAMSPDDAEQNPLTQSLRTLCVGWEGSAEVVPHSETEKQRWHESNTDSADEIKALKEKIAHLEKRLAHDVEQKKRLEESHLRLSRLYIENDSQGKEDVRPEVEAKYLLSLTNQVVLCKKCRKRLEIRILSDTTAVRNECEGVSVVYGSIVAMGHVHNSK